ncbi:hypothetical protein M2132_001149 [Dysgonomonas sp. PH5-45]|uniref:hypothetical protein n=1 Tax=unclassified Dysgonomonas TaxID=2630389 RepID=UPI0024740FA1|nr:MULTISPECIES: hypothetical protein [unclassified Dysgonomonas]MDH6354818.1 hypothetical protein [Dysgonomonas sp. PH5-45]MDH6387717.1 hypothetical protein [Dysgonomonas sp. PH5-37]
MKKIIFNVFLLLLVSLSTAAQTVEKRTIINIDDLSDEQLENIPNMISHDGWVLIKYNGENMVLNLSNTDYRLSFSTNCANDERMPFFMIEYSENYRDGDYGGIDFVSSKIDDKEPDFLIDGKSFGNPFHKFENNAFKKFIEALKEAKTFTIAIYDTNSKGKTKLNRSIDFKLANSELLDSFGICP